MGFFLFRQFKSINANYLINEDSFKKINLDHDIPKNIVPKIFGFHQVVLESIRQIYTYIQTQIQEEFYNSRDNSLIY